MLYCITLVYFRYPILLVDSELLLILGPTHFKGHRLSKTSATMREALCSVPSNGRDTYLGIETIKQQSNQQSRQKGYSSH